VVNYHYHEKGDWHGTHETLTRAAAGGNPGARARSPRNGGGHPPGGTIALDEPAQVDDEPLALVFEPETFAEEEDELAPIEEQSFLSFVAGWAFVQWVDGTFLGELLQKTIFYSFFEGTFFAFLDRIIDAALNSSGDTVWLALFFGFAVIPLCLLLTAVFYPIALIDEALKFWLAKLA